jgi:hypothetical protein
MDSASIQVVSLALIAAIVTPLVVAGIGFLNKRIDWSRQDQVAATLRDTEAAKAAMTQQQNAVLDEIHSWVNSKMTASMQSEYDALAQALSLLKADTGPPTPEKVASIAVAESKIAALRVALDERQRMQKLVDMRVRGTP